MTNIGCCMSLRKPPTMTPARLAANRCNAQKSTGPRTERGKAQTRMNALRRGMRSAVYIKLLTALMDAPPDSVEATAKAVLTAEQAVHPLLRDVVERAFEVEEAMCRG